MGVAVAERVEWEIDFLVSGSAGELVFEDWSKCKGSVDTDEFSLVWFLSGLASGDDEDEEEEDEDNDDDAVFVWVWGVKDGSVVEERLFIELKEGEITLLGAEVNKFGGDDEKEDEGDAELDSENVQKVLLKLSIEVEVWGGG